MRCVCTRPHIGATALPVDVDGSSSLPGGSSAVTATASRNGRHTAVTVTNRHWDQPASVRIAGIGAASDSGGQILAPDSPAAVNSAAQPDRVAPAPLDVARDGDSYRVELPPHSVATIVFGAV